MINKAQKVASKNQGFGFLCALFAVFLFALVFVVDVNAAHKNIYSPEASDRPWSTLATESDVDARDTKQVYRQYAQSSKRSKSDVIKEVKGRYKGAKILRIKLDSSGTKYKVRVLLPSGKVRDVTASAKK